MKRLGNYEIVKCIGATELTMLYSARHIYLGKELAMEASPAENDELLQSRLKFLARLLGKLKHPKILPIVDAFEDGKMMYLVFEWPPEVLNLEQIIKEEGRLSIDRTLNLTLDVCSVLRYLEQEGVVHQNLRPVNFLIGKDYFYLGGYTLANTIKDSFQEQRRSLDDARFASPEWLLREPICTQQDVWALGTCMYYMLSGKVPFEGDSDKEVGEYILEAKYKPLETVVSDVPESILNLVRRMLSRDKTSRPSFEEIVDIVEGQLYLTPVASMFVAMPFHPHFNRVYQTIKKVCQKCRVRPIRVDENLIPSNIWKDIENGIKTSSFTLGDLSPVPGVGQSNPNVSFEVGLAYSLEKPTILLTQDVEKLPFDFKQQRAFLYGNDENQLKELEVKLTEVIHTLLKDKK